MDDADSRVGARFGPYELRALLGRGGMGEVYEAFDTVKDRVVAVKLLPADLAKDPVFQQRFRHESRAAARLAEPHVIPIHDWGEIDGVLYIDMRLVRGRDLRSLLREKGALSPVRAVAVIEQIAAALDAAHAEGLVHRDVKPANILVTASDFAYLADFGIARSTGDPGLTDTGAAVGSYSYIAPERLDNVPVSGTADVYSLTCVLYECLTGAQPFPAAAMSVLIRAHLSTPPPRPSAECSGLPTAMDDVIARGMAKDPADRYPTARALAVAARAALTPPPVRDAASPPAPPTVVFPAVEPADKHADPPADEATTRRIPNPLTAATPEARPPSPPPGPRPRADGSAPAPHRPGPESGPNPRRTGPDSDALPLRGHRTSHGAPRAPASGPREATSTPPRGYPPRPNASAAQSGTPEAGRRPTRAAEESSPRAVRSNPPQTGTAQSGSSQAGTAESQGGRSGGSAVDPSPSNAIPTIDLAALGSGAVAGSSAAPTVGLDALAGGSTGTGPRGADGVTTRTGFPSRTGTGSETSGRPEDRCDPATVDMNAARPTVPAPAVAGADRRGGGGPEQRRQAQSRIVPPGQFGAAPYGRVDETAVTMERSALASAAPARPRARRGRWVVGLLVLVVLVIVAGVVGWVVRGGGEDQLSPIPGTGLRLPDGARACTTTEPVAGRFTASAVGTAVTSCPFAEAVRTAYGTSVGEAATGEEHEVYATSPVNGREYAMRCVVGADFVTCEGGENAVVYLY